MTFQVFDRLKEVVTTSGTGSFTAPGTGVATGFRALSTIGDTNTHFYVATDFASNWEVGLGTYTASGTVFARTTIYASSNAGAAVNFSTPPTVFGDMPATWFLNPTPLSLLISGIGGAGFVNCPAQSSSISTPAAGSFNFGANGSGNPQFRLPNGFAFTLDLSLIGASRSVQFNSVAGIAVVTSTAGSTRLGAILDVAAPAAQSLTVPNVVAGTTDTAGQDFTIQLSQSTGTGVEGRLVIQCCAPGSTGSAQNALATRAIIDHTGLAVTGALSCTAGLTVSGGNFFAGGSTPGFFVGSAGNTQIWNGGSYAWSSTSNASGSADTWFGRAGAANSFRFGNSDSASPASQTVQFQNGSGTNIAAVNATINAPLSTGNATNGDLVIQTGVKVASGTGGATKTEAARFKGETQQLLLNGALAGGSAASSIAAGTGAGTGPTISIAGNAVAGRVTLTTGTLPAAGGTVATITYANAFGTDSFVTLTPGNSNAAALNGLTMVFANGSASSFTITSGGTGLSAATQYIWNYIVIGK